MSSKPLPDLNDALTAPFWAATATGRLVVQACRSCGYLRWPPGPLCPECQAEATEWREVRPTGLVWSVATYHRALAPAFKEDVPYTVGLIELDDGPRMYGRMRGDPAKFVPGTRVHAVFREVAPGVALVDWEPDASVAGGEHRGVS